MVELFTVRLVHHLIAECKSSHPVSPVAKPRVPHASEVERAFTGTCTRVAPQELSPFPPRRDLHPLCTITACPQHLSQAQVFPCRPPPGLVASGRTSRLLSRQLQNDNEDYFDEPPSNRTSPSRGIRLYESASGGWLIPTPFIWLVARLLRLMPSIRITSVERFYVTDNRGRRIDRGD